MDNDLPPSTLQETSETEQQWRHLAPIAIIYFTTSKLRELFGNIVYLLPAIVIAYTNIVEHPAIWLPMITFFISLLLVFSFLSFRAYRYRLSENNIEIRSGVFKKKYLNLPFARIQNVKIEQPIYYRMSGFACLLLDTAGSSTEEAKVVALPLAFAEQLKLQILSQEQASSEHNDSTESSHDNSSVDKTEKVLNQRNMSDLIIHGITSNRIWIFLGGLAPFYNSISEKLIHWLDKMGLDFKQLFNLETHSMWQVGLYVFSLTMLVILVLVCFSIIGSIISFYGFTLSRIDDRYIRRSGLLTRHEVSMRLSRLQMIVRKQDWLDSLLNRINLKFEQSNDNNKNASGAAQNSRIIVPSISEIESAELIRDAYPDNQLSNIKFNPISTRFIFRYVFYFLLPILLSVYFVTIQYESSVSPLALTFVFFALSLLIVLRWKRWGFAMDNKYIYIRKGLFGIDYYCFPIYKIQQTQFIQSVFMKRRNIASVKLVLASGSKLIPLIDQQTAYALIDECLYQVESSHLSWM